LSGTMALSPQQRRELDERGYLVLNERLPEPVCDRLCKCLSAVVERAAREHQQGLRPSLDFWKIFTRSQRDAWAFWDLSRGDPSRLAPDQWEPFAMRVGHGLHEVEPEFRAACRQGVVGEALSQAVGGDPRVVQSAVVYKQPRSEAVQFG